QLNQTIWELQPDGNVTVYFEAYDKAGNHASMVLVLGKDTTAPVIEVSLDKQNPLYGHDIPIFSLKLTDPFLDLTKVRYSLDYGGSLFTITNISNTSINSIYWNGMPSGSYNLTIYARDIFGNQDSVTVMLEKDITAPELIIHDPIADGIWGFSPPSYNLTVSDPNVDSIEYSLDGGETMYSAPGMSGVIDNNAWYNLSKGEIFLTFYATDALGNANASVVRIFRDQAPPLITIYEPSTGILYGNGSVYFNITIIDDFLSEYWYKFSGSPEIHLLNETTGTIPLSIWENLSDGPVVIIFYANDTLGNLASNSTLIIKDTAIPDLTFSTTRDLFGIAPMSFELDIIESHLDILYYRIDNQSIIYNLINGSNEVLYSYWQSFESGNHTLHIQVNDTLGNTANIAYNFIKDTTVPNVTCLPPPIDKYYAFDPPVIDFVIEDMSDIDATWYRLEDSKERFLIDLNLSFVVLDESFWSNLSSGTWEIVICANDTAGNIGSSSVIINKDISAPVIHFLHPDADFIVSRETPPIVFTVEDANLKNVWYRIIGSNGFEFKSRPEDYNGSINETAWNSAFESLGTITLIIFAEDEFGTMSELEITFNCEEEKDLRVDLSNFIFKNAKSLVLVIGILVITAMIVAYTKKKRLGRKADTLVQNQMKKKGDKIDIVLSIGVLASFTIALSIILHQWIFWGRLWNWNDFLHHENFVFMFFSFGLGILLSLIGLIRNNQIKKKKIQHKKTIDEMMSE
ncbi:MAG: Ig-like domain-containing protein, partial [Candidatus Hodarchaeota archaeon]